MPEILLRPPGLVLVDHLQKNKEKIEKYKETGDSASIKLAFSMTWLMEILKI